jgi:hypothetical protein
MKIAMWVNIMKMKEWKERMIFEDIKLKTNTQILLKPENNNKWSCNLQNQNDELKARRTFPITLLTLICF